MNTVLYVPQVTLFNLAMRKPGDIYTVNIIDM